MPNPPDSLIPWRKYKAALAKWYHNPSYHAIQSTIAAYVNHIINLDDPVWLFTIGGPSSGKSSTVIDPLSYLPNTQLVASLNEKSLISGFGKKDNGLLFQLKNNSGVLLFSDFSTFISLPDHVRNQVQAQLREVYYGRLQRDLANKNKTISWKGRVTIIAATTNVIERTWKLNHDMGERFLNTRMVESIGDSSALLMKGLAQSGHREIIKKEISEAIKTYVGDSFNHSNDLTVSSSFLRGLNLLALNIIHLRRLVNRDSHGNTLDLGEVESPMRVYGNFFALTRAILVLNKRRVADSFEASVLRHVAKSSIKTSRVKILEYFYVINSDLSDYLPINSIVTATGIPYATVKRTCEDLTELGYLAREKKKSGTPEKLQYKLQQNDNTEILSSLFNKWSDV